MRRARNLRVYLTGTLGVLQAIHRTGHSRQSFAEDLDAPDRAGMYLTDDLRQLVVDRFRTGDVQQERE